MKICCTIYFVFLMNICFGQYASIYDSSGNCSVRSVENIDSIIDYIKNGHVVQGLHDSANWVTVLYSKNGIYRNGQINKSCIDLISDHLEIPIWFKKGRQKILLQKDSLKITLISQKFKKSKHRFAFYEEAEDQVQFIDSKTFWGTDGLVPTMEYKSITVEIRKRKIVLPRISFANLFEPALYYTAAYYDQAKDILYIQAMNSDGAGAYRVVWKIEKGVYKEQYIFVGMYVQGR